MVRNRWSGLCSVRAALTGSSSRRLQTLLLYCRDAPPPHSFGEWNGSSRHYSFRCPSHLNAERRAAGWGGRCGRRTARAQLITRNRSLGVSKCQRPAGQRLLQRAYVPHVYQDAVGGRIDGSARTHTRALGCHMHGGPKMICTFVLHVHTCHCPSVLSNGSWAAAHDSRERATQHPPPPREGNGDRQ